MKKFPKINPNIILGILLLAAITFSVIKIAMALDPNPGHIWSEIDDVSLGVAQGGTGLGTLTTGNVILGAGTGNVTFVAPGTSGNVLTSNGTIWQSTAPTGGGAPTDATYITQTANGTLSAEQALSGLATGPLKNTTGTGVLTVGSINLTSEVTGTLPVGNGGTGLATLTTGNVILGAGTGNVTFVVPSTAGNLLESNGTTWVSAVGGVLIGVQTIVTGTTSYTPTSGTTKAIIELWGGGGSGGDCSAVAGCAGGGGGSGGYARHYFTGMGAGPYTVAVGAAVTGTSGAAGTAGNITTFNTGALTIQANGGGGGAFTAGTAAIKFMAGGAGGAISTNGTVNGAGAPGGPGMTSTVATVNMSGFGGSTSLGGGGVGKSSTTGVAGTAAIANTGSGGSGAAAGTATANAGGGGAAGRIIIWEFR